MAPIGQPREKRFAFVVTEDEHAMLTKLAEADGRSAGDWLRRAIVLSYEEQFGALKKKPKR